MIDPKRWLDEDGSASSEERALLQAGRDNRMPAGLRERVWLGVAAGAGAAAAPGAAAALQKGVIGKSATSFLAGPIGKAVLAAVLVGGATIGSWSLRSSKKVEVQSTGRGVSLPSSTAAPAASIAVPAPGDVIDRAPADTSFPPEAANVATTPRSRAGEAQRASVHATNATAPPHEAAPAADGRVESREASRLREESAAVLEARTALLSGDAARALRVLDRVRAEFPNGALAEDREALTVRALIESGQKDAARVRGESFLRAFPRSPYAAEVRAILAR
jgi:hypothetical protein